MMARKTGREATVAAAWPSGLSQVSQAYEAWRRCEAEEACANRLFRAPGSIHVPVGFCPSGGEFSRAKSKARRYS